MQEIFKKFAKEEKGVVAIMFALSLIVIIGVVALAFDGNRIFGAKANSQGAVDSAALAAAEEVTKYRINNNNRQIVPANLNAEVKKIFLANLANGASVFELAGDPDVVVSGDTVTVTACFFQKNTFAPIAFGSADSKTKVCSIANAGIPTGIYNVEIAFSLDQTNSMLDDINGNNIGTPKINSLTTAMQSILDNYLSKSQDSYAAIVPFTDAMTIWPYHKVMVNGGDANSNVTMYKFPLFSVSSLISASGGGNNFRKFDNMQHEVNYKKDPIRKQAVLNRMNFNSDPNYPATTIQPLTQNFTLLKSFVTDFKNAIPRHAPTPMFPGTSGLNGLIGAWLTLAPGWKGYWNAPSAYEKFKKTSFDRSNLPNNYSASNPKFIIHITDGEDNFRGKCTDNIDKSSVLNAIQSCVYNNPNPNVALPGPNYDALYTAVCNKIKSEGIEIFIVLYGASAKSYHTKCVDAAHLFVNVTPQTLPDKLNQIFDKITAETANIRIIQ